MYSPLTAIKSTLTSKFKNIQLTRAVLILALCTFVLSAFFLPHTRNKTIASFQRPLSSLFDSNRVLPSPPQDHLDNLPIGKTSKYETANAWGTAILIPQYHRYPGTDYDNPINNSAEKAQKEIYEILPHLRDKFQTKLIMMEGELYGKVPAEKIDTISSKIQYRDSFVAQSKKLETLLQRDGLDSTEKKFLQRVQKALANIDRDIILEGAPLKLKANDNSLVLFGSENQATREQSKILVRNYIYLQNRERELQGSQKHLSSRPQKSDTLFNNADLKALLSKLLGSQNALDNELRKFETIAKTQQDGELLKVLKNIKTTLTSFDNLEKPPSTPLSSKKTLGNPYKKVNSIKEIKSELEDTEQKINDIVVEKRNLETAQNFSTMLKSENQQTGILQYGAGHEEGLTKELQKQGLSVIVITPSEVERRNSELANKK